MLSISSIRERSADVLQRQFGIFLDNLFVAHPGCEPAQNVVNADAHATDARPAAALARFDGDVLSVRLHLFVARIAREPLRLSNGAELLCLVLPNSADGAGLGIHVRPHIQCQSTTVGHNCLEP